MVERKAVLSMNRTHFNLALTSLLIFLMFSGISQACIGEVASHVHFNVSVGSSETLQMQIFNSCRNQSVNFNAFAQLQPVINQTTPTITVSPKNGTLAPSENQFINITVSVPSNDTINTTWSGGAAAIESANATQVSGASLESGVAKILTVTATAPLKSTFPYALIAVIAAVMIIAVIIASSLLHLHHKSKKSGAAAEGKAAGKKGEAVGRKRRAAGKKRKASRKT